MEMKQRGGNEFDVAVIGGGPAGSTAAGLLALAGRRVILFERERFPRFHIGESLMPDTYWPLKRLGMLERLGASEFPRKYSVQFISESGKASRPFYFPEYRPHDCSVTWQVERAEFDQMLLERARELGVEVREGWSVREVLFEGERAVGVRAAEAGPPGSPADATGPAEDFRARVVIDASGQSALIARRLGLVRKDPKLVKAAVFAHYENALRDFSYRSDRCAGDGWVLVGDAFGFLDPIYSSGVLLALKSAELAADTVHAALEKGDVSASALGAYGQVLAKGMEAIRKLVYAYYTPNFSFAKFVHEHPEHRSRIVEILTGNVFKEGIEEIFRDMAQYFDMPEERPLQGEGGKPGAAAGRR
jgi:flavin-dependent dehydrogenase